VSSELGLSRCYTLEASLAGSSSSGLHFGWRDYRELGQALCGALALLD
jgi:hypothetical protein